MKNILNTWIWQRIDWNGMTLFYQQHIHMIVKSFEVDSGGIRCGVVWCDMWSNEIPMFFLHIKNWTGVESQCIRLLITTLIHCNSFINIQTLFIHLIWHEYEYKILVTWIRNDNVHFGLFSYSTEMDIFDLPFGSSFLGRLDWIDDSIHVEVCLAYE